MSQGNKGIIGSVAVHIGIIAVIVGASWFAAHQSGKSIEPVDPLLVDLNGIPGRRPGEVGKAEGVAQGQPEGSKKGISIIKFKKIVPEKESAESSSTSSTNSAKSSAQSSAKTTVSKSSSTGSKTTLSEFNNSKSGKSGAGKVASIGGVSVRAGRNYGKGDNGGAGGSASELQLYIGEVRARFQSALLSLVSSEAELDSGKCGVTLRVDAAGNVKFGSWINRPQNSSMISIVKQAIDQIGNCGTPPGRNAFQIDFTSVILND